MVRRKLNAKKYRRWLDQRPAEPMWGAARMGPDSACASEQHNDRETRQKCVGREGRTEYFSHTQRWDGEADVVYFV